jgi:hypothetical protein
MHDLMSAGHQGAHDLFDEVTGSKQAYFGQISMTFIIQIV